MCKNVKLVYTGCLNGINKNFFKFLLLDFDLNTFLRINHIFQELLYLYEETFIFVADHTDTF